MGLHAASQRVSHGSSERILLRPANHHCSARFSQSFGPNFQLLQVSFGSDSFAIGGYFSLDHQLFCKACICEVLHVRSVCQCYHKDLCSLKESLLSDMWHHALGTSLYSCLSFEKVLVCFNVRLHMVHLMVSKDASLHISPSCDAIYAQS